ncbi:MAG: UTP--glucose-1-phosphate uridylyltransferase GalU [Gammaproteobacteria bacterium]|nr:UTP--glucose-1-phosphate uridylyltransferase GalU [Gammaproteobacteria bacterium]
MNKITKAVFPVAGLGTRFLPATKASPKEMLPVVDKPLIQYAVEEAIEAGITELIFVTSSTKRAIEDHFDKSYELESELEKKGKIDALNMVRSIVPKGVSCVYVRQAEALGLGHAVLCAKSVVGDHPFAVILPDDLLDGEGSGVISQMVNAYISTKSSQLGVEEVPKEDTDKYGIVNISSTDDSGHSSKVEKIVEKPRPEQASSNLAVVGRYILTPRIFDLLEITEKGAGGEIQLTDAISALLQEQDVYAYRFAGKRYDCGSKLGYLKATVEYGLKHADFGDAFSEYLSTLNA